MVFDKITYLQNALPNARTNCTGSAKAAKFKEFIVNSKQNQELVENNNKAEKFNLNYHTCMISLRFNDPPKATVTWTVTSAYSSSRAFLMSC